MIIGYTQKRDGLDISYVDANNQISIEEILLDDGFFQLVECEESDPNKIPNLKSFNGSFIRKDSAKYFSHHNINEFFNQEIPSKFTAQNEKFSQMRIPNPFSVDIETDISDKHGYSSQTEALNSIRSISFTDSSLQSILFIVKNPEHPEITDVDKLQIANILQDSLKEYCNKYSFDFSIRIFDTEVEMLNVFLECMNKHFHLIIGWNFLDFDWQYIFNRCEKLGIDVKKASPTRKLTKKTIDVNDKTKITLQIPAHRILADYMILFKESLIYNNLGSYSLDTTAEMILGLNKVTYDGNLRTLYEKAYLRFISYAFIDTILVMLIHKATNLLTVDFFQSYYTKVPYLNLSQNSISEALVYLELRKDNLFLLESEKTNNQKRKYQGGYVKAPTKKNVNSCWGLDFKALYPNSMITMGLSPEAKIDEILVDMSGIPINSNEITKWLKYKNMGFALTPLGRVYDVNKDYLYTRIEKGLLNSRGVFQGYDEDIYLNIITKLETEIQKRKMQVI